MKKKAIIFVVLLQCAMAAMVPMRAQKTTRKGLITEKIAKNKIAGENVTLQLDTVRLPGDMISLYGYEKPLSSSKEGLHVKNNSDEAELRAIIMEIGYLDYEGNELHRREVNIDCKVPPGSTRLLYFPSWDLQKRFYYAEGPRPRGQAYPYTIEIKVEKGVFLYSDEVISQ